MKKRYSLDYDLEEREALECLDGVKSEITQECYSTARALISNGEWEVGLSHVMMVCLSNKGFRDINAAERLVRAVRNTEDIKNAGSVDKALLLALQTALDERRSTQ